MCSKKITTEEFLLRNILKFEPDFPGILSWQHQDTETHLILEISAEHRCFQGHFPGNPVLPGIVQVHWAVIVSRALFEFDNRPREIKQLKFKSVVIPSTVIDLALSRPSENEVRFEYSSPGQHHSQGRLIFEGQIPC